MELVSRPFPLPLYRQESLVIAIHENLLCIECRTLARVMRRDCLRMFATWQLEAGPTFFASCDEVTKVVEDFMSLACVKSSC